MPKDDSCWLVLFVSSHKKIEVVRFVAEVQVEFEDEIEVGIEVQLKVEGVEVQGEVLMGMCVRMQFPLHLRLIE
ncbi:hypothetical protein ACLB2K_026665 [Fragaria x ananassa]